MVAMLRSCEVTLFGLEVDTQQLHSAHASLGNMCAAEREQLFVLLIVQEAAIPVTICNWSTTIADSCPWIIPTWLMCEGFQGIFLWVNIQHNVNVSDSCYVELHICESMGHTMYQDDKLNSHIICYRIMQTTQIEKKLQFELGFPH